MMGRSSIGISVDTLSIEFVNKAIGLRGGKITHLIGCVEDVLIVFCGDHFDEVGISSCFCGLSDNGASMAASNSCCKVPTDSVGDPLGPSTIGSCSFVTLEGD